MFEQDVDLLHGYVERFRAYQKKYYPHITEENDNGEWEISADCWDEMNTAYLNIVETYGAESLTEGLLDDMLYVIARDNECSHLLVKTLDYPDWFEVLCRHSINADYYNAKWQFAEQLGNYEGKREIKELLFYFIESGEEYVERMALKSLLAFKSLRRMPVSLIV
ncbi:MAG: hypothetical protein Q4D32_12670 [Eubacteriales bacterium]|nr:hypothetical protein [Eubacteriales bacterium]